MDLFYAITYELGVCEALEAASSHTKFF